MKKIRVLKVQPDKETIRELKKMNAKISYIKAFTSKKKALSYFDKAQKKGFTPLLYKDSLGWNVEIEG